MRQSVKLLKPQYLLQCGLISRSLRITVLLLGAIRQPHGVVNCDEQVHLIRKPLPKGLFGAYRNRRRKHVIKRKFADKPDQSLYY